MYVFIRSNSQVVTSALLEQGYQLFLHGEPRKDEKDPLLVMEEIRKSDLIVLDLSIDDLSIISTELGIALALNKNIVCLASDEQWLRLSSDYTYWMLPLITRLNTWADLENFLID